MPALLNVPALGTLAALLGLAACSPALNWRDARLEGTPLRVLLPCKPDSASKEVPLAGQAAALRMLGCDAGELTFAVAVADLGSSAQSGPALAQWQRATLANMKAEAGQEVRSMKITGAAPEPAPLLVKASGRRPDGTPVAGHAAYFAQGGQVYQAVVYGKLIPTEASETFFESIRFE